MRRLKFVLSALLFLCLFSSADSKKGDKPVYIFGLSTSFTDTIVYCTEVQLADSVALDKNGFLPQRETYSYQLKNYLETDKNRKNSTCAVYFSNDKRKLTKELDKIMLQNKKNKKVSVEKIEKANFTFTKPEEY